MGLNNNVAHTTHGILKGHGYKHQHCTNNTWDLTTTAFHKQHMGFSRAPMLQLSRHGYKQQHVISCLDPWHWLQKSKDKVRPDPKLHWCLGADFKHQGTALWKVPCPTQSLLKPFSLLRPFQRSCTNLGSCGFCIGNVCVCAYVGALDILLHLFGLFKISQAHEPQITNHISNA